MFRMINDVPLVTVDWNDDGRREVLRELCLEQEAAIHSLPLSPGWRSGVHNETSARYSHYNLFLFKHPVVKDVFDLVRAAYREMTENLRLAPCSLFIQCWINVHHRGEALQRHAHPYPMHGHLTVHAQGTETVYDIGEEVRLANRNGRLTLLGRHGVPHWVTPHPDPTSPRISVAFDLLPQAWIEQDPKWREVYAQRQFIPFD